MKSSGSRAVSRLVALLLVLGAADLATASCDPSTDPDRTDIANARAAVEATCHCTDAENHGTYVRCSADTLASTLANPDCKRVAQACAARSTCGRPGAVTCCRTSAKGVKKCSIRRDATRCRAPRGGTACQGSAPSCCDACPPTGCPTTTTTLFTVQCNRDCSGTPCPEGQAGAYLRSQCGCAPIPACGGSGGVCGGNCPVDVPTEGCHYDTYNGCCLCGGP